MNKIATPQDFQAELRSISAFVQSHPDKPEREIVAAKLRDLANRVAERAPEAPKLISQLLSTADTLYDARGPLRKMQRTLQSILDDASGTSGLELYDDADVEKLRDATRSLDGVLGDAARGMENLARRVKKP
jgi:hypothetical protein